MILTLGLQLVLPSETPLPAEPMLVPRHARPITARPIPDYPAILQAPIFAPDRAPTAAGTGGGPSSGFSLVGVALGPGFGVAVVRTDDGKSQSVRKGDSVMGWRLVSLTAKHAVFVQGEQRIGLDLNPDNAQSAGPAASAPAADDQETSQ